MAEKINLNIYNNHFTQMRPFATGDWRQHDAEDLLNAD